MSMTVALPGAMGELVGVGDEQLAVVIEEREADGREAVGGDGAEEGVAGVVLEGGGVEDEDGVVTAGGDVDGAAVGGDGHAYGAAAGVEEAQCRVAVVLGAVIGGRRGGFDGIDDEESAVGVGGDADVQAAVPVLELGDVVPGRRSGRSFARTSSTA